MVSQFATPFKFLEGYVLPYINASLPGTELNGTRSPSMVSKIPSLINAPNSSLSESLLAPQPLGTTRTLTPSHTGETPRSQSMLTKCTAEPPALPPIDKNMSHYVESNYTAPTEDTRAHVPGECLTPGATKSDILQGYMKHDDIIKPHPTLNVRQRHACPKCHRTYSRSEHLTRHLLNRKLQHSPRASQQCAMCSF